MSLAESRTIPVSVGSAMLFTAWYTFADIDRYETVYGLYSTVGKREGASRVEFAMAWLHTSCQIVKDHKKGWSRRLSSADTCELHVTSAVCESSCM